MLVMVIFICSLMQEKETSDNVQHHKYIHSPAEGSPFFFPTSTHSPFASISFVLRYLVHYAVFCHWVQHWFNSFMSELLILVAEFRAIGYIITHDPHAPSFIQASLSSST